MPLSEMEDIHLCHFASANGKLHTGPLYQLLVATQSTDCPISKFVWKNKVPRGYSSSRGF